MKKKSAKDRVPGRREQNAETKKKSLTTSALSLFRKKGFDEVTVDEITRAAGVSKGSFYTYFETKSDIIVEAFWKIDRYYHEYASRNLNRYVSSVDKLLGFTRAQMRYVRDHVGVENLQILYANQVTGAGNDSVILNPKRQWYKIITGIIEDGQKTGEFRDDEAASVLARNFNRAIRGVFLDWCISNGSFNLAREAMKYCRDWLIPPLLKQPQKLQSN